MEHLIEIGYYLFYAGLIGVFAFFYIIIFYDPEMVGAPLYRFLDPIMDKTMVTRWIKKPLMDCVHCNAGQIALWFYLIRYWEYNYNFFLHAGFIALSIVIAHILKNKYGN